MRIVIANSVGRLSSGKHLILFPSRWDQGCAEHYFSYYPYELAYLSTLLKRDTKHNVVMVDGNHYQLGAEDYAQLILSKNPDLVVTECSALTYPDMTRCFQTVREKLPAVTGYLTGPYGAANEEKAKADGWNEIFVGEYERDVLWRVSGWTLRDDFGYYRTSQNAVDPGWQKEKPYINLDELPWPEDEDIKRIEYSEISNPFPGMVQVYCTRGCPLACTFCAVPLYYGGHGNSHKSHRVRNVDDIADEITYLAGKYGDRFSGCFFNEETHNANPEWLGRFAQKLIDRGLNRYFYDAMCGYWGWTEELIQLLKNAGYCHLRIGIESMSEKVGSQIRKKVIPEKLQQFLEWCRKYKILVYGTTQIGAPGSTMESDIETLKDLWELKSENLIYRWQHSVSTPQPGTPLYDTAKREGRLLTEDISEYNGIQPIIRWDDYPPEEVRKVKSLHCRYAPPLESPREILKAL